MKKILYVKDEAVIAEREMPIGDIKELLAFEDTAVYEWEFDGACLLRWPQTKKAAILPDKINGAELTRIAPLAFAAFHMPSHVMEQLEDETLVSFGAFCMKNANQIVYEPQDMGGPEYVVIPPGVRRIGAYAFYRCHNLIQVVLPEGIENLEIGLFGDCTNLKELRLPNTLRRIGFFPRRGKSCMPDIGTFAGCHKLRTLSLPKTAMEIGAESFNGSGLESLFVTDEGEFEWARHMSVHESAFHHTASLLHLGKQSPNGEIVWMIGLPKKKDRILSSDKAYGVILRLPLLFFSYSPRELDERSKELFRLDFIVPMAISRLQYPRFLSEEMQRWYVEALVDHFDRLQVLDLADCKELYQILELFEETSVFGREHIGKLLRLAGEAHMETALIAEMVSIRNRKFTKDTGFEELEL